MTRFIKSFNNDAAIQAAIENKSLGKPYVAFDESTGKIDWNTKDVPRWYKVDEMKDGGTYILVSNGYVLLNNNGSAAAAAVTVSGGVIEYDAPASAILSAAASDGKFTLSNNGQYMQRGGSSGSYAPVFSSSPVSYYKWSYDSAGSYISSTQNSTYYVYYTTGNSKWSMSTSGGDSHKADLYELKNNN